MLMRYAELARAREAGEGPGETFAPKTLEDSKENVGGGPDIDDDLVNARRALRTARSVVPSSANESRTIDFLSCRLVGIIVSQVGGPCFI